MTDKFHGQGGDYEVRNGERVLKANSTKPGPAGGGAHDADGKPLAETRKETDLAKAFTKPKPAPWARAAAPAQDATSDVPTVDTRKLKSKTEG